MVSMMIRIPGYNHMERKATYETLKLEIAGLRRELDAARADVARLRDALDLYGRHLPSCACCTSLHGKGYGGCDCGLTAAERVKP